MIYLMRNIQIGMLIVKVFDLQYIEAISLDIFTIPYIQGYFGLNGASGSASSGRKSSSSSSSLDLLSSPFSTEKGKKKKKKKKLNNPA